MHHRATVAIGGRRRPHEIRAGLTARVKHRPVSGMSGRRALLVRPGPRPASDFGALSFGGRSKDQNCRLPAGVVYRKNTETRVPEYVDQRVTHGQRD